MDFKLLILINNYNGAFDPVLLRSGDMVNFRVLHSGDVSVVLLHDAGPDTNNPAAVRAQGQAYRVLRDVHHDKHLLQAFHCDGLAVGLQPNRGP